VDKLGKQLITILVQDTIVARKLALLFLLHVIRHVKFLKTIISDRGP
jgi:hypothetical protein